jgi:hypothetical protein
MMHLMKNNDKKAISRHLGIAFFVLNSILVMPTRFVSSIRAAGTKAGFRGA